MAGRKKFRPNKSEYDRVIEDYGLTGIMNKDMNRYPKLDVCPLPFPFSDPQVTEKMEQLNTIAADLEQKFRKSIDERTAYIHPKVIGTPDVVRFLDKSVLKEASHIDYARLPLELHPDYLEIKLQQRKNRRKFKPKNVNLETIKQRTADELKSAKDTGGFTQDELNDLTGEMNGEKDKVDEPNDTVGSDDEDSADDLGGDYVVEYKDYENGDGSDNDGGDDDD